MRPAAGAPEQAEAGAGRQDRGHVQAPRPVGAQPDGGPLARLEGELALAVHGDDARPGVDRVHGSGVHPLDLAHPHRDHQPRCDGGEDAARRLGGDAGGDPVRFVPGDALEGPAIIEAETTTVLVDTGDRVNVNALGWLDIVLR